MLQAVSEADPVSAPSGRPSSDRPRRIQDGKREGRYGTDRRLLSASESRPAWETGVKEASSWPGIRDCSLFIDAKMNSRYGTMWPSGRAECGYLIPENLEQKINSGRFFKRFITLFFRSLHRDGLPFHRRRYSRAGRHPEQGYPVGLRGAGRRL